VPDLEADRVRQSRGAHRVSPASAAAVVSARCTTALDELERPGAERELDATRGAEQVRGERKIRTLHVREQQCRTAAGDHPPMNLRGFELRIDWRADFDELPIAAKLIEEGSQIAEDLP
jgi:hypothetical protein